MKKFISISFLVVLFTASAFAQLPPIGQCGFLHTDGVICEPPHRPGAEAAAEIKTERDDSVLTVIKTFIADHNPFVYFLN